MRSSRPQRRNSGQVLIITSLIVVMLLLSAVIYVNETEKNAPNNVTEPNVDSAQAKQAALHTAVSALANITSGGNVGVLIDDLNRLKAVLTANSYGTIFNMAYAPLISSPYQDGVWISWGSNGDGVSSIYADFVLNSTGISSSQYLEFGVNVTSSINVIGTYTSSNASTWRVSVTCTVFNEDQPSLARNLAAYYEQSEPTEWVEPASLGTVDYGNGTYLLQFSLDSQTDPLQISVRCLDARGIYVWANATATQR